MKKLKGVIFGASRDAVHTIKKAKEKGVYVVVLDGNINAEGMKYADEAVNVDISNIEKVYQVIEQIQPDFILPVPIGRYLITTGLVNEKYNLKGVRYLPTEWSTDKYIFHKKLNEQGLRNIQVNLVNKDTNPETVQKKYPVIIKPRYGSGSRDVFVINNEDEFLAAYKVIKKKNEDFIMEEAVSGEEYGVDGAVIDGNLSITLIRKKMLTPLPIRQAVGSIVVEKGKLFEKIEKRIEEVIKVLEYDNCLLNADVIVNEEEVFAIEISPRPSGHNLHNVFVPISTGIDLAEEYIKFLMGNPYKFEAEHIGCMQIRYFNFEDKIIHRIPKLEELQEKLNNSIVQWNCNIHKGEFMGKVIDGHSIMGRGFFIVEGKDEEELMEKSEYILSQFQ